MTDAIASEYFELLRFRSVGADPAHLRDCADCAGWLCRWLERLGFTTSLKMPPVVGGVAAPPVVTAERHGDDGAPSVLFYGHYDVQPAEESDGWTSPPFEPTVRGDRVFCRGAQDDKGQFFAFLCGMRDWLEAPSERPRPTVKIVLEGQEESGSGALISLLGGLRRSLAADVLLACDTEAGGGLRPAIVAGMRGVSHFSLRLTCASRELHSGSYGGVAPNAAQAMAALVATLHAKDGSVAVAGFSDGAEPPSEEELRLAESVAPSAADIEKEIGCVPAGGRRKASIAMRRSFEPTIELNGIHSGYGGPGAKTVIPCEAVAKLSMRFVPGQSPARAMESVRRHLEERVPEGARLEFTECSAGAAGFRLPLASPLFRLAQDVLTEMDPRGPAFTWDGASIPAVSAVAAASGAAPLIVGWGLPEDRIHSPDESYSFKQFDKAREWGCRILAAI